MSVQPKTYREIHQPAQENWAGDSRLERDRIEKMIAGDSAAWTGFVHQYAALIRWRVSGVASRFDIRHDESMIDDVTAEVFSALVASDYAVLRAFEGRSRLSTYLSVVAARIAMRWFRRVARMTVVSLDALQLQRAGVEGRNAMDPVDPNQPDGGDRLSRKQEVGRLLRFIDQLPENWSKIVLAHHRDGMTYQQISERFQIPIGSVGTTLRRAESRLRERMREDAS